MHFIHRWSKWSDREASQFHLAYMQYRRCTVCNKQQERIL